MEERSHIILSDRSERRYLPLAISRQAFCEFLNPLLAISLACALASTLLAGAAAILSPETMRRDVEEFNHLDHTYFGQAISNEAAAD